MHEGGKEREDTFSWMQVKNDCQSYEWRGLFWIAEFVTILAAVSIDQGPLNQKLYRKHFVLPLAAPFIFAEGRDPHAYNSLSLLK